MKTGMICIQESKHVVPGSRHLSEYCLLPKDRLYTDEGIRVIADFLESFRASGMTCISEKIACWLQDSRDRLPSSVALWIPPKNVVLKTQSKERQITAAREAGLPVLPTYIIEQVSYDSKVIPKDDYPLCLRPSGNVQQRFKVMLARDSRKLGRIIEGANFDQGRIIAQPFMNLPNLVVHGCRTVKGDDLPFHAFIVPDKFEGVTLTMRPAPLPDEIKKKCSSFVQAMDIVGPYHFEFIWDGPDRYWFLEINARLGGTTGKALACGYDEPLMALAAYESIENMKLNFPTGSNALNATVTGRVALCKYIIKSIKGKLSPLDFPQRSRLESLIFFLKSMALSKDEVFSLNDLQGTLALWKASLRKDS